MEKIIVKGGQQLKGTVKVEGAKNAVLPVIAASLLASEGKSVISDVPELADVYTINQVLRNMNAKVDFNNNMVTVDASRKIKTEADRKSTRLNSSHVAISYAVFCLKK